MEALVALGKGRDLKGGEHTVELHGHQDGVFHLALGGAGVDALAVEGEGGGGGVEIFVFQAARAAAVHGVGEIRSEARDVEMIRALADLLVRGKGCLLYTSRCV